MKQERVGQVGWEGGKAEQGRARVRQGKVGQGTVVRQDETR